MFCFFYKKKKKKLKLFDGFVYDLKLKKNFLLKKKKKRKIVNRKTLYKHFAKVFKFLKKWKKLLVVKENEIENFRDKKTSFILEYRFKRDKDSLKLKYLLFKNKNLSTYFNNVKLKKSILTYFFIVNYNLNVYYLKNLNNKHLNKKYLKKKALFKIILNRALYLLRKRSSNFLIKYKKKLFFRMLYYNYIASKQSNYQDEYLINKALEYGLDDKQKFKNKKHRDAHKYAYRNFLKKELKKGSISYEKSLEDQEFVEKVMQQNNDLSFRSQCLFVKRNKDVDQIYHYLKLAHGLNKHSYKDRCSFLAKAKSLIEKNSYEKRIFERSNKKKKRAYFRKYFTNIIEINKKLEYLKYFKKVIKKKIINKFKIKIKDFIIFNKRKSIKKFFKSNKYIQNIRNYYYGENINTNVRELLKYFEYVYNDSLGFVNLNDLRLYYYYKKNNTKYDLNYKLNFLILKSKIKKFKKENEEFENIENEPLTIEEKKKEKRLVLSDILKKKNSEEIILNIKKRQLLKKKKQNNKKLKENFYYKYYIENLNEIKQDFSISETSLNKKNLFIYNKYLKLQRKIQTKTNINNFFNYYYSNNSNYINLLQKVRCRKVFFVKLKSKKKLYKYHYKYFFRNNVINKQRVFDFGKGFFKVGNYFLLKNKKKKKQNKKKKKKNPQYYTRKKKKKKYSTIRYFFFFLKIFFFNFFIFNFLFFFFFFFI